LSSASRFFSLLARDLPAYHAVTDVCSTVRRAEDRIFLAAIVAIRNRARYTSASAGDVRSHREFDRAAAIRLDQTVIM